MSSNLLIMAIILCLLVLIVLMLGIGSFLKGGEISKRYSNKLMRIRIIVQAIAVLIIITFVYFDMRG